MEIANNLIRLEVLFYIEKKNYYKHGGTPSCLKNKVRFRFFLLELQGRRGCDRIVVGFTIKCLLNLFVYTYYNV